MEITKINDTAHINQTTNFKAKITQLPKINASYDTLSDINPSYYQNLYGINPSILVDIVFADGTDEVLDIKPKDIRKYLCKQTGEIDPERVKQFAFLYKLISQGMKNEHNKEKERYIQSFNTQINISNNDEYEPTDDEEFVRNQLNNLDIDEMTNIKDAILYALEAESEEIPSIAYERTLRLFQLSKTKEGYDFSMLDKKLDIIEDIEEIQLEYGMHYSTDELYDEVITASKDENGNIDFSLISASFDMMFQMGFVVSPKLVINIIKKYVSKNPHNRGKILDTMNKLNKSDFSMDDNKNDFEDLMDLCFQGYHFNSKRAEKMLELTKYAKVWINTQQQKMAYKGIDRAVFRYKLYSEFCKSIIKDYFKEVKNKNCDFDQIKIEDFFNSRTKGVYFI